MKKSPELKPTKYDALVAAAVLLLAAVLGVRVWFAPVQTAAELVVTVNGTVAERLPLRTAKRSYSGNGYTVHLTLSESGARVDWADCPTQDCVRTGSISRPGQSIVCLPARIVISLEGATDAPYDAIAG